MLNPYLIGGAALAVIAAGGVGYLKGHEHASVECEAARAVALEESAEALVNVIEKTEQQMREAQAEAIRINDLLDNETEAGNIQAANFQDRIDGIRTETPLDVDCPTVSYDGLYELLRDAASGSPSDITASGSSSSTKRTAETVPQ